jgi:hypothetical protein
MRHVFRRRPSAALVVACVALAVALAGTGYATVRLPRNSVGTAQLKKNAVVSSKVKNYSLRRVDFKPGQVPRGATGPPGPAGPAGPQGPPGVAAPGYVAQVVSQTSTTVSRTSSATFVDLPGAAQALTVPTGETARLYIWFTAESACSGGTGSCRVRIVVDGNQALPASGSDFNFDSTNDGRETPSSWEGHAMARLTDTLPAGTHTVRVQFSTSSASTAFWLDDWALIIERTKES